MASSGKAKRGRETGGDDEYVAIEELSQTLTIPGLDGMGEESESEEEGEADPDDPDISGSEMDGPTTSTRSGRPKRGAAMAALKNVSTWMGKGKTGGGGEEAALPPPAKVPRAEPPTKPPVVTKAKRAKSAKGEGSGGSEDVMEEDGDGLRSPDGQPVYGRKLLTFAAAEQLLLVPDTTHESKDSVCKSIPIYCPNQKGGFTFLIDATFLYKIEDLPVDGYGSWTAGGSRASSRSRYYVQMPNGDLMRVDSTVKSNREPATWDIKLTQTRYIHPAAARCFQKMTYCVRDRDLGVKRWAAVTYRWLSEPFSFKPLPHGNCKGGKKELKPFQRTYPSILAAMKSQLPLKMPKHVLEDIEAEYGLGSAEQRTPLPALPRNRKQLYNLNREAAKDLGGPIDHRKWRKTGPAAGRPPGEYEVEEMSLEDGVAYMGGDGYVHYVIEASQIPGIPDDDFARLNEAAEALLLHDWRFKDSAEDPAWCSVEDETLVHVRQEVGEGDGGRFRCSCDEFEAFHQLVCRHTLAVATRRGKLDEHLGLLQAVTVAEAEEGGGGGELADLLAVPKTADLGPDQPSTSTYHLVSDHQVLLGREEEVVAGDEFPTNILAT